MKSCNNYKFSLLGTPDLTTFDTRTDISDAETRKHIVMIGDSFVFGDGLEYDQTISSILQNLYGDKYLVVNLGVSGSDLEDAVRHLNRWAARFPNNIVGIVFGCTFHSRKRKMWTSIDYPEHYPTNDAYPPLYSLNTIHKVRHEDNPIPIDDLVNWEKSILSAYWISRALNAKLLAWDIGNSDYLSQDDRDHIELGLTELDIELINLTFPDPTISFLPDGHWNGIGNAVLAERIFNLFGNLG
jgi:hypothetical protein